MTAPDLYDAWHSLTPKQRANELDNGLTRLTDEELASMSNSAAGGHLFPSHEVRRLIAEIRERRAQDFNEDERMLLYWVRRVADTWRGTDAPRARALLDKLLTRGNR